MNTFDLFNGLRILKEFDTFCNAHPFCQCCPLYAKSISCCATEMGVENRQVWQKKLEEKIRQKFEEADEQGDEE